MNLQRLGTEYGGWWVDLDSISPGCFVLDCGVGEDVSFSERLIKLRDCNVIGVDPSYASLRYVVKRRIVGYSFVLGAISPKGNPLQMCHSRGSESYCSDHPMVLNTTYTAPGVSLAELVKTFSPEVIKLDVEGMEYNVATEAIGVHQVCIEFHHRMIRRFKSSDTELVIQKFLDSGYKIIKRTDLDEVTLLL